MTIKLTQTVQKGGCAAKVAAMELRKILKQVRFPPTDANLLVDGRGFDDAAIYRVSSDLALVQTLDFFTPIVDTPKLFGRIAAANALSDVYAMGGEPKTAMAILAFPMAALDSEVCVEVLQGASDVLAEAQVGLVGGHSIDDGTLKFGLSVTGFVHRERVWTNAGALVGDTLILTKPLGTGTAAAALKRQALSENDLADVLASMGQINSVLDLLSSAHIEAIHAATDITGFGLAGHSMQMAVASEKTFHFRFADLPKFSISRRCLEGDFLTKAHRSNAEYTKSMLQMNLTDKFDQLLFFDPQTSGGLLLAVQPTQAPQILEKLKSRFPHAAIVGQVEERASRALVVD